MTGVTVGIGAFRNMAERAARSFEMHCKLPTKILDEQDMMSCKARHPNWLRFYIFDLVQDENIVYFDADTLTLGDYQPEQYSSLEAFLTVRDVPSSFTARDGRMLGYPLDRCMNGGWFIANRTHHKNFFRECRKAARHYHALLFPMNKDEFIVDTSKYLVNPHKIFFDQPIFNLLIYRMDIPTRFVDRRHNYIGYGHGDLWQQQEDIFVAHFPTGLRRLYSEHTNPKAPTTGMRWKTDQQAFEMQAGCWSLTQDGSSRKDIFFRQDGTIVGWRGRHYWFVTTDGDLIISRWDNIDIQMRYSYGEWFSNNRSVAISR